MIEERLMKPGRWSLRLRDDTPKSVRDLLTLETACFGHVCVTATRIADITLTSALVLAASRYTGIYRSRPSEYDMGGPGLAAWLADEDGKGDIIETALTKTAGTFVQWITDLKPASLDAGTYNVVAGGLSHSFLLIDRRTALDYMCEYFGAEWKITADLALHGGTEAQLFVTTPTAIVNRRSGGRDPNVTGIRADVDTVKDLDDYATRVVLLANGPGAAVAVGTADISPATSFRDGNGNLVELARIIESSDTAAGNENTVAAAQLAALTDLRREVKLSSDDYHIGSDAAVGDSINVWDEQLDLFDLTNPVQYRGEVIYPIVLRVVACTWPVRDGMGVYFRAPDVTGTITDLTDWVEWEDGATAIEVGAESRTSTDQLTPGSLQRTAALGPQGSLGYAEGTTLQSGITTITDITGCSKQVTVGPNRRLRIIGHALIGVTGTPGFIGYIREGSTELGRFGQDNTLNTTKLFEGSVVVRSPSAGAHTYKLSAIRVAGADSVDVRGSSHTSWIDIIDEGPDF